MKPMILMCLAALLAACQSADVEVVQPEWPDGTTAAEAVLLAEAMPPVVVVQSIEYGSGEATATIAGGAAEALPLAVAAETGAAPVSEPGQAGTEPAPLPAEGDTDPDPAPEQGGTDPAGAPGNTPPPDGDAP